MFSVTIEQLQAQVDNMNKQNIRLHGKNNKLHKRINTIHANNVANKRQVKRLQAQVLKNKTAHTNMGQKTVFGFIYQ